MGAEGKFSGQKAKVVKGEARGQKLGRHAQCSPAIGSAFGFDNTPPLHSHIIQREVNPLAFSSPSQSSSSILYSSKWSPPLTPLFHWILSVLKLTLKFYVTTLPLLPLGYPISVSFAHSSY